MVEDVLILVGVPIVTAPLLVIAVKFMPFPADTDVIPPDAGVAHVGTPPATVSTCPAVPMARLDSVTPLDAYRRSPTV